MLVIASSAPPEKFANTNLNFLTPNGGAVVAKDRAAAPLPCIIYWPGAIPAGQTSSLVFSAADFGPTALEIAGQKPAAQFSGRSWLGEFTQPTPPGK